MEEMEEQYYIILYIGDDYSTTYRLLPEDSQLVPEFKRAAQEIEMSPEITSKLWESFKNLPKMKSGNSYSICGIIEYLPWVF